MIITLLQEKISEPIYVEINFETQKTINFN